MRRIAFALAVLGICFIGTNAFAEGNDANTVLLLHFNGTDGSTSFVDDSVAGGHTVTAYGDAQVDTAQSKFGTGSLFLDGTGDYLSIPDSDDWTFGTGDFTIDFWIRFNDNTNVQCYVLQDQDQDGNTNNIWRVAWDTNILLLEFVSGGVSQGFYYCPWSPSTNTWYHLAFVRNGSDGLIFIDGSSQLLTEVYAFGGTYLSDLTGLLYIGVGVGQNTQYFNGWIDELRISKGIARWTSSFTLPVNEYDAFPFPNNPPLAHAGGDAEAYVNEEVTLDGSGSLDSDGEIVSWVWRSLSDPQNSVVAEGEITTMNAHGHAEELIELTVTDDRGGTGADTMIITNPGVVGPPGITPEEIAAMQQQLDDNRYLLEQLPQLKKKLEALQTQVQE